MKTTRTTKRKMTPTNRRSCASQTKTRLACSAVGAIISLMGWNAKDIALLNRLWSAGQSAAQIARRLGCSRNAVCGMLTRLGLKRGHKPPTATPEIRPRPKLRPTSSAACARPVAPKVSRNAVQRQPPKEFSKQQLYSMLAEAVRNTG
ncbi:MULTISPECIES: GcrA family cell cycle regulator [unclassified Bradyrhizobium]|jgi:GcrA cell cycle regulator|uniref:GcrA family cell cycle regulator n=2 Tax=Nitrobacteraceae TaxID=41294 RepID=UPI0031F715B9